ncbi:MAG: hypothetical protein LAQ69_43225 [Acidobacteriia bacterium]|nr:hypothetical protein [Terriglobia bacterium]
MRAETPLPLTLAEHLELARELRASNVRLRELCKLIVTVYGPNNQAAFTFQKVAETMERLCNDMQAQAAQDYPGYPIDNLYT